MSVPPILVLGNVNVDLVLGPVDGWPAIGTEVMVERSEMRAGGSAGNSALALSGLGVAHRLIASVGMDPNGQWLQNAFDPACCDWIVDRGAATTLTVGIVHKGGDRAFFTTPGHLQSARLEDLLERIPPAPHEAACAIISGGFLMPALCAGTADLLRALKEQGWQCAIDPGWPPEGWSAAARERLHDWMRLCDHVLLNAEELRGLTGEATVEAAALALSLPGVLVVKCGADGAQAFGGGARHAAPAPAVAVIDTVGAGDTFNAGYLAALSGGASLHRALQAGVAAAAQAISTFPRRYR